MNAPTDPRKDAELVASLARGEIEAASALYERHASMLLGVALRIVADVAAAEDVVHDAFVSARERACHYVPSHGTVIGWLIVVTRNLSLDHARQTARRGAILRNRVGTEPPTRPRNPEELMSAAVDRQRLRTALSKLPEAHRATLELLFFEGLTHSQLAARDRVPLGTVKSRAARALLSMQRVLGSPAQERRPSSKT